MVLICSGVLMPALTALLVLLASSETSYSPKTCCLSLSGLAWPRDTLADAVLLKLDDFSLALFFASGIVAIYSSLISTVPALTFLYLRLFMAGEFDKFFDESRFTIFTSVAGVRNAVLTSLLVDTEFSLRSSKFDRVLSMDGRSFCFDGDSV